MNTNQTSHDNRLMAAAIRLARRNEGRTGTNPSVACVLVQENEDNPVIVGSGITAVGGRPHAEPVALAEAGDKANGSTAYVTLEPCAHHGSTPPCAQTLIDAGVIRVVTAVVDPDERVNQLGHKMLSDAGLNVEIDCEAEQAAIGLAAYLNRKTNNRCYVTLKLAVSADGYLGARSKGQVNITGPLSGNQTHLMRARHQAILVGSGTIIEDDPQLTCRLNGLEGRSPIRIILDPNGKVSVNSKIIQTSKSTRSIIVVSENIDVKKREELIKAGCEILPCEMQNDRVALPELLEDLSNIGIVNLMVEGGAQIAEAFLDAGLVDEIALFTSPNEIQKIATGELIRSPISCSAISDGFVQSYNLMLGEDDLTLYTRINKAT